MSDFAGRIQMGIKNASFSLTAFIIRLISGGFLGLTLSLALQEAMGHKPGEGFFSFIFAIVIVVGVFLRLTRTWTVTSVLIFDLIAVLVGMLLRLYVIMAPGV